MFRRNRTVAQRRGGGKSRFAPGAAARVLPPSQPLLDRTGDAAILASVNQEIIDRLGGAIRDVQDFPQPGIVFKDITPVLACGELFRLAIDGFIATIGPEAPSKVVGIDARGFIFGAALADRLGAGFVPVRKKGKLPWQTAGRSYSLEYGHAEVEIHRDAVQPGEKVVLIDDLLATGGTAGAALQIVRELGAEVLCVSFLIELAFLEGRRNLDSDVRVETLLTY